MPKALQFGCGYELFWKLNPYKLRAFEKAYTERLKNLNDYIDTLAWRTGYYEAQAMGLYWGKAKKYPEKPDSMRDFAAEERQRIHEYMRRHSEAMREKKRRKEQAEVKENG